LRYDLDAEVRLKQSDTMQKAMEVARWCDEHLATTRRGQVDLRAPELRRALISSSTFNTGAKPTSNIRPPVPETKRLTIEEMARRLEKGLYYMFVFCANFARSIQCRSMNTRNRNRQPSPSPSPPRRQCQAPPAMDLTQLIVKFQRMNAPTFSGTKNPTAVLEWMKELDKIFAVLPLPDRQCVSLAAYQMKEDASDWWIEIWARRPEAELHALTWEQMKVMVRSKFLPQSFWDRMEHEFYHLQQGSSRVDEYIRTFTRMCLFAGNFGRRDDRPTQGQMPRCPKCGRFHAGECLADQRACYNCNRAGHFASVCPEPRRQQQQQQRLPQQQQLPPPPHQQQQQPPPFQQRTGGQARVYTLTHDEAARNAGTMSGMLSISHVPVFSLCDTGATHSFISSRCLEALSLSTVHACDPLEVSLASGKVIVSDSVVRNLPIC
ncbi:Unknown protein, partial [Striga hermonthica]